MKKTVEVNNRQGGSYIKDANTGKSTLVEQTKHQEITGFEQQKENVVKAKSTAKKGK